MLGVEQRPRWGKNVSTAAFLYAHDWLGGWMLRIVKNRKPMNQCRYTRFWKHTVLWRHNRTEYGIDMGLCEAWCGNHFLQRVSSSCQRRDTSSTCPLPSNGVNPRSIPKFGCLDVLCHSSFRVKSGLVYCDDHRFFGGKKRQASKIKTTYYIYIYRIFLEWGHPSNGKFTMENPIKMDNWVVPQSQEPPTYVYVVQKGQGCYFSNCKQHFHLHPLRCSAGLISTLAGPGTERGWEGRLGIRSMAGDSK